MNSIINLIRVQSMNFFGINTFLHTKDKKEKRKGILVGIAIIYLIIVMLPGTGFYYYMMMKVYDSLGVPEALLSVVMAMASVMCLITTVYKGSQILFGFSDFDIIMPMPIKASHIVISKLVVLYLMNIGFTLFIMAPAAAVYAYFVAPGALFYVYITLMTFALPLLPIIVATALSVLISLVSGRFRSKNMITIVLTLIFLVGVMMISFSATNLSDQVFTDISVYLKNTINGIYPLASIFTDAVCNGNIISLIIFLSISALAFALFAALVSKIFKPVRSYLNTSASNSSFKMQAVTSRSALNTLYRKEARRYFASPIYVTNTIIGVIMLTLMSGVLFFGGGDMLEKVLEIPGISETIGAIIPLIMATLAGMTNTSCISISMEGKSFPLLKSLPVSAMTVFKSKILFNLTLTIPAVLINAPLISFILKLDLYRAAMTFIIPILFSFICAIFGIVINLFFPSFNWTNEVNVVKQSMASMIGILVPMFFGMAASVGVALLDSAYTNIALAGIAVLFALITVLLYVYLKKKGDAAYNKLV